MRRLILFDIDGTLMTDGGAARAALDRALASVYQYEGDLSQYDFSGRTDPQIAFMVLRDAGFDDATIEGRLPQLWDEYLSGLRVNAADPGKVRVLEGIVPLLDALEAQRDVVLALLTGNLEPGARLKLDAAGLNQRFAFGAFGSDSQHREELPPFAIRRARERAGHQFSPEDVVIIGDSIYDVRCGVPHGATTIAVASGRTPIDRLRAEHPTHLFETSADPGMLAAILGR